MKWSLLGLFLLLSISLTAVVDNVVYYDDFSKSEPDGGSSVQKLIGTLGWGWDFPLCMSYVTDSTLVVAKDNHGRDVISSQSRYIHFDPNKDFSYSVELKWFSELDPKNQPDKKMGLIWGGNSGQKDFLYFGIDHNGEYALYKMKDSAGNSELSMSSLEPVIKGNVTLHSSGKYGIWRKLTLKQVGDLFHLIINDQVVTTIPAIRRTGCRIGLFVDGNQCVQFRKLSLIQNVVGQHSLPSFEKETLMDFTTKSPSSFYEDKGDARYTLVPGTGFSVTTDKKRYVNLFSYPVNSADDYFVDLEMQCDILSNEIKSTFGLQWGAEGAAKPNFFVIDNRGYFTLNYQNGIFKNPCYSIRPKKRNTLSIARVGSEYQFRINGDLVAVRPSESYNNHQIGIYQDPSLWVNYSRMTMKKHELSLETWDQPLKQWNLTSSDTPFLLGAKTDKGFAYTAKGLECITSSSVRDTYVTHGLDTLATGLIDCRLTVGMSQTSQTGAVGLFIGNSKKDAYFFGVSSDGNWHFRRCNIGKKERHGLTDEIAQISKHEVSMQVAGKVWSFLVDGVVVKTVAVNDLQPQEYGILAEENSTCVFTNLSFYRFAPEKKMNLLLDEPFDENTRNWTVEDNANDYFAIKNGVYIMMNNVNQTSKSSIPLDLNSSVDYCFEAEMQWITGITNNGFGMTFNRKDWDNYTSFEISQNGSYVLRNEVEGDYFNLIPWKQEPRICKDGSNRLKIWKHEDYLYLFINDVLVDIAPKRSDVGNQLGFVLEGNQNIRVNWLRVYGEQ